MSRFSKKFFQGEVVAKFKNNAVNEVIRIFQANDYYFLMSFDLATGLARYVDASTVLASSKLADNAAAKVLLLNILETDFAYLANNAQLIVLFGADYNTFVLPSSLNIPSVGYVEAQEDILSNTTIIKLTGHVKRLQNLLKLNNIDFPAFK